MIDRTVLDAVERGIKERAVTLITGARQVGKTTLCLEIASKHGFKYVSLANSRNRSAAMKDPDGFLADHGTPLIIDEVQYAPALFDAIESVVDDAKVKTGRNKGMYILTGSQAYNLMEGATQSMAGRISIIKMSPLSMSELYSREEVPFKVDPRACFKRAEELDLSPNDIYELVFRGMFPELHDGEKLDSNAFYADYVRSYIMEDVSQIINVKDSNKFMEFIELMASLTGQELVYGNIANTLGVNIKTIQSWVGVLVAGDVVRLLRPHYEGSAARRLTKRPKIYFCDTGLACYLARVPDIESLKAGYLRGHMVETFIVNEILKTYENRRENAGFYYYRDSQMSEIDLIIMQNGRLSLIECKSGITFDASDVKAFDKLAKSDYEVGPSCVICMADRPYPIKDGVHAIPISSI